jgi:L-asparaginase
MKLVFIQTGGTIDKDYPKKTKGYAFEFGEPATSRILERLNPSFEYEIVTSCQKDSLEITQQDRFNLVDLIKASKNNKFIITHGTDTMLETAKFIRERIQNKLIVITGSMLPERFINSEASINVGAAIAVTNLLEKGVFIAMHGIVKPDIDMNRDLETGRYY